MIFLIFIILNLTSNSLAQFSYYEGDFCRASSFNGECRLLENCPKVNEDMISGKSPEMICGFIGYEVVVCCPFDNPISNTRSTSTTPSTTTTKISSKTRKATQVSEEKCAEYAKSALKTVTPPTLNMNKKPINVSTCNSMPGVLYVIGGTKAEPRRHPHMAAVGFDTDEGIKWLCGGTLISDRYVLTAAHCLFSRSWGNAAWVRLGDLNLKKDNDDANPKNFRISQRIKHQDYKSSALYHDIALLKLDEKVEFDAWIKPACLPSTDTKEDEYGIATGWGKVDWIDDLGSDDLLEVILKIVPNQQCNKFYSNNTEKLNHGVVSNWQICAGEQGKDTCQGDSGGPLTVVNNRHNCVYNIIGVTSVGSICGTSVPGIYTRVSHYVTWIQKIVWP